MPIFVKNDPGQFKCSPKDVIEYLNQFNFKELYIIISKATIYIYNYLDIGTKEINTASLARLSLLLLSIEGKGTKSVSKEEFIRINQMVNSIEEYYFKENYVFEKKNREEIINQYLLPTLYNQFVFNIFSLPYKISNQWFLFNKENKLSDNLYNNMKLNDYFSYAFNKSYELFISILFIIFSFAIETNYKGIVPVKLISNGLNKEEKEMFDFILDKYSKSYYELRDIFSNNTKYNQTDNYMFKFNIFRDYPILKFEEDSYYIPNIHFLALKLTENIYFDIIDFYANEDKTLCPSNKNHYNNRFSRFYGLNIEKLINEVFALSSIKGRYLSEFMYTKKAEKKSAEFHLLEGSNLVLIQAKNKRAIISSQLGNYQNYLKDIDEAIIKPHKQNLDLLSDKQFIEEIKKRLKIKKELKSIYSVVITPEDFLLKEVTTVTSYIKKEINDYILKKILQTSGVKIFYLHTSILALQMLVDFSCYKNYSIVHTLKDFFIYIENPINLSGEGAGDLTYSFEEFMMNKLRNQEPKSIFLKKYYENGFEKCAKTIFKDR